MNRLIALFVFMALADSCSSNRAKEEKDEPEKEDTPSEILEVSKPMLTKETISNITNTIWIQEPFPNCTDTLILGEDEGTFYRCEKNLKLKIEFRTDSDTLYVDEFGLRSEVDANMGIEVKSKYKLIRSGKKLVIVDIAHKYQDTFRSVEEQYLYQEFKQIGN